MTWSHLLTLAGGALMSGGGTWATVAIAKIVPFIPLSAGQKARIRTVALVLASASTIALGVADGSLTAPDAQNALAASVASLGAFLTSWAVHWTVKKATQQQ